MGKIIDGEGEVQETSPNEKEERPQGLGIARKFVVQANGSFLPPPPKEKDKGTGE